MTTVDGPVSTLPGGTSIGGPRMAPQRQDDHRGLTTAGASSGASRPYAARAAWTRLAICGIRYALPVNLTNNCRNAINAPTLIAPAATRSHIAATHYSQSRLASPTAEPI
jgi:hypothetical protein